MSDLEIYRNRAELLAKSLRERDEALERCGQMIFDLQQEIKNMRDMLFAINDEAKELREQRDAARRDFCNGAYDDPHLVAKERGWDCFKEDGK